MRIRHQLAAFSPVPLRAVLAGARGIGGSANLAHERLIELLRIEYAADEVILCGSGTQALQLAIELCSRAASAKLPVALPAFGCFDLVSAAIGAKAPIVLYDLDYRNADSPSPLFFRARLDKGVMQVPRRDSEEVRG